MLAENLFDLAILLSFNSATTLSTSLMLVAVLPIDSRREPCHSEYVIVIVCSSLVSS